MYTNLKELLLSIRYQGKTYLNFKPFTLVEMMAFISLIILNRLIPSIWFEYKFEI